MLQAEAVDRATRLPKITIHNETEVIESVPTANEMGGVTHPWTTVAINCARMQSYFEVLIRQHVAASAQQLHRDFKPRGSCDTKELLGSGRIVDDKAPHLSHVT